MGYCKFCYKKALFAYDKNDKAIYCGTHKNKNMINVYAKYCVEENCKNHASFGYPLFNEYYKDADIDKIAGKILYCSKHKLPKMINLKQHTCIHVNCKTIASYGYENNGRKFPLYCSKHKLYDKFIHT